MSYATTPSDTLVGTIGADSIYGFAGNDSISGGDGADLVYGGGDNDTVNGGFGSDTLYGAPHVREVVRCSIFPLFLVWAG